MRKKLLSVCMLIASFMFFLSAAGDGRTFVTIGTGGITGIYYPTGAAIAKMINQKKRGHDIRATAESTGGSVFNINAVVNGDLEFALVQSDRQYQAVNGLAEWKDKGPQKDLRSVFSLYPESVTLVAAVDTGIRDIRDLKGKTVNIGNPGSGQRQNALDALAAVGIDPDKDIQAKGFKASEAPGHLQDGSIDAFFYTVGHPNPAIKEATSGTRKVRFVSISGIDNLLARYPYYMKSFIPAALYPGAQNTQDTETFGVKATLVTTANVPEETVYEITRAVFENLADFIKLDAVYASMTKESMLENLSAPLHPGAMKYYREIGLK